MPANISATTDHMPIQIIIADDHPAIIDGFCFALRKHKNLRVTGKAYNGEQLVQLVAELQPDIVFTDIQMPLKDGIAATKEITQSFPHIKVIAFSGFMDDCYVADMMIDAKASGYILKEAPKKEILNAIEKVCNGEIYCSEQVMTKLITLAQRTKTNPVKPFSKPV